MPSYGRLGFIGKINNVDKHRLIVHIQIMNADELKKWRKKNGYSQAHLAKILGVEVMTVSRWERGIMRPPSFLHLALGYLEMKGDKIKPEKTRKRERRK
jgi:DNA-binding transcriptional regulator YiaG